MTTPTTLDEIIEKVTGALIMCIGECPEAYRVELDEALEEWADEYPESYKAVFEAEGPAGEILRNIETSATGRVGTLTPEQRARAVKALALGFVEITPENAAEVAKALDAEDAKNDQDDTK